MLFGPPVAVVLLLLSLAAAGCGDTAAREGVAAEVHAFTGARTRVVWVQGDGTDPYAMGTNLVLMGLDTEDGRGERAILPARGSYVKPLFTASGDRIVYSTHPDLGDPAVHVVHFDGSGARRFDRGFAMALWTDPADGRDWVFIGSEYQDLGYRVITRVALDRPSERQEVWNGPPISIDTFQVSPDGTLAGGLFPWPAAGVADLRTRQWKQFGEGCWTALNDVGRPLLWYFDGAHRNLLLVDVLRDRRWTVPINRAPGFVNPEVYHPRWLRHPRFVAMSGPYDQGGANQVRSGGRQAEIWMGRFNDDYTAIEAWQRVTTNAAGDSYPDVWIDRDNSRYPQLASGRIGPAAAETATVAADRMVVDARLVGVTVVPTPESIAPYRNALVVNRYEIVEVVEGQPAGREIAVAEWAIHDARVLAGARFDVGQVRRMTLARYEAHPELEGERLIQDGGIDRLPLYYDSSRSPASGRD